MLDYNIVLIADRIYKNKNQLDMTSNQLEKIDDSYFSHIFNALSRISNKVTHYSELSDFIDRIKEHKNDIVFTIYGGDSSRNRMALVPAICEAYGIKYVGADVYNRVICQDKDISKEIAKKLGLNIANSVVASGVDTLLNIDFHKLRFPLVVKPILEGSSIGITAKSLCTNIEEVIETAHESIIKYQQPVLIEEFIEGKEVVVCIIGNSKNIKFCEAVERYKRDDPKYFYKHLFTSETKFILREDIKERKITDELDITTMTKLKKGFKSFGKMDYMRIDGRIKDNKFYFIEFTPDASLSKNNPFKFVYELNNKTFDDVLTDIIKSALENYLIL